MIWTSVFFGKSEPPFAAPALQCRMGSVGWAEGGRGAGVWHLRGTYETRTSGPCALTVTQCLLSGGESSRDLLWRTQSFGGADKADTRILQQLVQLRRSSSVSSW